MHVFDLAAPDDFDGWRDHARGLALAAIPPEKVSWRVAGEGGDLFGQSGSQANRAGYQPLSVPRAFIDLARSAICHSDPERFALLYGLLLRVCATPAILTDKADPLIRRVEALAKAVRRDLHKMHAFVRFREVEGAGEGMRFVAWFEPDHHIVRAASGFFVDRFTTMDWSILTPDLSIHWDGARLRESPGATRALAPSGDPVEDIWKRYYAAIFNPARLKVKAMMKEMPRKYWANMPETALIGSLIAGARNREVAMVEQSQKWLPDGQEEGLSTHAIWSDLRKEAAACTRCVLHHCATQTVFGEGPVDARLMFVGEQPGDQEDLAGRAFVGPAGQLLDRALADAGIDRTHAYVTNAVKHFKFEQRGKTRLHARPNAGEIRHCRWWLDRERALIKPSLTVALGATAAHALMGRALSVSSVRGTAQMAMDGGETWVTVHPSFLLRVTENKEAEYRRFVDDLRVIARRLEALA
ncbi:MAG: UdgX family uracil-DNA binding protein [Sphingomonadaceae bacterium]|nr:UdgX family uracil-DNA binding protein [Sphingomonadaceae bacterium]